MATATVNGVKLFYELSGTGKDNMVLVHGSWVSHHDWDLVVPRFAESFHVLTYDRRGHSRSERPTRQGSIREDVADLAGLIERLGFAPAWVVGNSLGAAIALRLAGERPDLFRGVIAHEPPLLSLLSGDPAVAPILTDVRHSLGSVAQRIASGDHAGAAQVFVDTIAVGPGTWQEIRPQVQSIIIENAPTFLDEVNDPELLTFDLESIKAFPRPVLLTTGGQSPPLFAPVVAKVANVLPHVEVVTLPTAGHIPHVTDPDGYAETIQSFIRKHRM